MSTYRTVVRPLLFRLDPERVHHLTMTACQAAAAVPPLLDVLARTFAGEPEAVLATEVMGVRYASPVGLSAGYDKSGQALPVLSRLGFGYVDVGSVSWEASDGNPGRPRLWRLPLDDVLMVNYGVPNDGAEVVARRLASRPSRVPLSVTLVETNTGKPGEADHVIAEMTAATKSFTGMIDVLSISAYCPNETLGTRPLADPHNLRRLFASLGEIPNLPPVVLKIKAYGEQIDRIVEAAAPFPFVRGFLPSVGPARPYVDLRTPSAIVDPLPGSATGPYSKPYLLASIREWRAKIDRTRHVVIANGGIRSGEDAYAAIRAGASLVGLVTALVYQGPGIANRINRELAALLKRDGFEHVADAVGTEEAVK